MKNHCGLEKDFFFFFFFGSRLEKVKFIVFLLLFMFIYLFIMLFKENFIKMWNTEMSPSAPISDTMPRLKGPKKIFCTRGKNKINK